METKEIKEFYNTTLQSSKNVYENDRWFVNRQSKSAYYSTLRAVEKYASPLLQEVKSVFELGPGPGTWTKIMLMSAPEADYELVDISKEMLGQAQAALADFSNIKYTVSDILDFSPEKKYDFFFSSRMIEYVPEKKLAVKTIVDALQPNAYGYIVTKTPQYNRLFRRKNRTKIHTYQISPEDLSALLVQAGCQIKHQVHVTCVFPKLGSGPLDTLLTSISTVLPFWMMTGVSESYALVFQKQ